MFIYNDEGKAREKLKYTYDLKFKGGKYQKF